MMAQQSRTLPARGSLDNLRTANASAYKHTAAVDRALRQFMRKRTLLLALVGNEIERLCVWCVKRQLRLDNFDVLSCRYNPLGVPERMIAREGDVHKWREDTYRDIRTESKLLRENTRYAWEMSPSLAVHICARFKNNDACRQVRAKISNACM